MLTLVLGACFGWASCRFSQLEKQALEEFHEIVPGEYELVSGMEENVRIIDVEISRSQSFTDQFFFRCSFDIEYKLDYFLSYSEGSGGPCCSDFYKSHYDIDLFGIEREHVKGFSQRIY